MKSKFNTYDLICCISELQRLIGLRVNQVYDVDNKTYLVKLQQGDDKAVLLFESGIRIHTTSFEWPKNASPSGFTMKLRKHIRNKRLEKINQLGIDRIVDMQFGIGEAAYHVILELYDRGNILLTDHEYIILNLLRPHTEGDKVKFVVREKYPSDRGKERPPPPTECLLKDIFSKSKSDDTLKKIMVPHFVYGPAIIEHVLHKLGINPGCKLKDFNFEDNCSKLLESLAIAEELINEAINGLHKKMFGVYTGLVSGGCEGHLLEKIQKDNTELAISDSVTKGYIIQKKEKKLKDGEDFFSNQEFHPMIFDQHKSQPFAEFETFDAAVDEFFSSMETQKIDLKGVQQELAAMKKLENVKKDHEKRLTALECVQIEDVKKAELITRNLDLVDAGLLAITRAVANQMTWSDISNMVKEATSYNDPIASYIKQLKLNVNHITMLLRDPFEEYDENGESLYKPTLVDLDLDLSAYANAEKYYDRRRQAATKQRKTLESQAKAFKSAEKKTKQTLKEVKTSVTISKARKVYWFEKFFWFISSENYLVIGGRDQQQNEFIVKRYLKTNDIYVHAGITGASSIVIKNPTSEPVPPKTLNEAGVMAICYSTAWDAKVVTSAWWVHANQVSKKAPTGEYLSTGSFMIRGKKNFLPQCHLILGFSFMFRLEDGSIEKHIGERKKRDFEETEAAEIFLNETEHVQLEVNDDESDEEHDKEKALNMIEEEAVFPDTEIIVKHKGDGMEVEISKHEENTLNRKRNEIIKEQVIFLGDDEPVIVKPPQKMKEKHTEKTVSFQNINVADDSVPPEQIAEKKEKPQQPQKLKRGQKSKLKKIKEKYKDQDEEERKLMLKILQGTPSQKKEDKRKKREKKILKSLTKGPQPKKMPAPVQLLSVEDAPPFEEEDDDEEEKEVQPDEDLLNTLTGQPMPEDELLFAIPVVAPYNTLINYKYKVKLTPGTSKRGKAAQTALNVFLKDKSCTQREKDLLKHVKDQDLARNFPGKVKISAPQLTKLKS